MKRFTFWCESESAGKARTGQVMTGARTVAKTATARVARRFEPALRED